MSDILTDFDALTRKEQNAWSAWFNGGLQNITTFSHQTSGVFMGKAECEWVDFDEFWLKKLPAMGWMTIDVEGPFDPGGNPDAGYTVTRYKLTITDKGWAIREAELERFKKHLAAQI